MQPASCTTSGQLQDKPEIEGNEPSLVFDPQVLKDFLLMPVDPAGEDQEQQLPRLQDRLHISPDIVRKVEGSGISGCLSTAGKRDRAVQRNICGYRDLRFG